jgi:predicted regulator of Ras-like GTPase activity (Roadblock/LC7/MglB family)
MSNYQSQIATMQELQGVTAVGIANGSGQIVTTSSPAIEAELVSIAASMYANLGVQIKRMQRGILKRILLETEQGITLISGLSDGNLLIAFVSSAEGFNLSKLLETAARL